MDQRLPLPRQIRALRIVVRGEGGEGYYSEACEELHHPCNKPGCHGGGLDLHAKVREMAGRLEARFRGEMTCSGQESMGRYSQSCLRGFTVDISIEYGDLGSAPAAAAPGSR
jgi:hypothetical protein